MTVDAPVAPVNNKTLTTTVVLQQSYLVRLGQLNLNLSLAVQKQDFIDCIKQQSCFILVAADTFMIVTTLCCWEQRPSLVIL